MAEENPITPELLEAFTKFNDAIRKSTGVTSAYSEAQAIAEKKQRDLERRIDSLNSAIDNLKSGVTKGLSSFGQALNAQTSGLAKYQSGVDSMHDGLASVVKLIPGFGQGLVMVTGALTALAGSLTKQADKIMETYDDLAKAGIGASQTYKELVTLATNAGYTSENMSKFGNAFKSLNGNMIALGGTTKGALDKFGKLTDMYSEGGKVIKEQMDKYRSLGYSQEEYTQAQADTVGYLVSTGQSLSTFTKNQKTLADATGNYLDNLTKLSTLTGQSVEQQKKQQEEASRTVQIQQHQNELSKEEARLRKLNTPDATKKADEIKARLDMEKALLAEALRQGGGDKNSMQYVGAMELISTGTLHSKLGAANLASNPNMQRDFEQYLSMRNEKGEADVSKAIAKYQEDQLKAGDIRNQIFGSTVKFSGNAAQFAQSQGMTVESEEVRRQMANAAEGKTAGQRAAEADEATKPKDDSTLGFVKFMRDASRNFGVITTKLSNIVNPYAAALALNTFALGALTIALFKYSGKISGWGGSVLETLKKGAGGGAATVATEGAVAAEGAAAAGAAGTAGAVAAEGAAAAGAAGTAAAGTAAAGGAGMAARGAGMLSKGMKFLGKAKGGIGGLLGGIALDYAADKLTESGHEKLGATADIGSSALTGAGMGLMFGPVGAAIGGALGGAYGLYKNWGTLMGSDKKKIEEKHKNEQEAIEKEKKDKDDLTKASQTQLDGFSYALVNAATNLDKLSTSVAALNAQLQAKQEGPSAASVAGGGLAGLAGGGGGGGGGGGSGGAGAGGGGGGGGRGSTAFGQPTQSRMFSPPSGGGVTAKGGGSGRMATVSTKSGKSVQVGDEYAKSFQGFINDLEATGYKIKDLGGYVDRPNRNAPGVKSYHALGAAIDINPAANPNNSTKTDLPAQTSALAAKWGLGWGMNWRRVKDPMHFSAARHEDGAYDVPLQRMALGGITNGMSIAGEAGREAVVPLPNGRSIPVDLMSNKHPQDVARDAVAKAMGTGGGGMEMNKVMQDMSNANKEMLNIMREGFREMNSKLDRSNQLQDKLVKYSM